MRFFYRVAICFLALAGVQVAAGQTNPTKSGAGAKPPQQAAGAAQTPVVEPKPGPEIERLLRSLGGTWAIKETFSPDAALPTGDTGAGRVVWRPGPGGYSVIEEYESKQSRRSVTGLAVFWWDEAEHGYRTIWCDSTNPGGCIQFKNVARWGGAQLVLVEDYEIKGKKFTFKEVFGDITTAAFTQTLYGGEAGGELKVDQTIHATKLTRGATGETRK
ncbi:MAG TPA: hypothetical protein VFE61_05815 [Candidatus Sulfotelmatobacter sp.]|nr:hypothetical protein [Candidatus Sulfotelmatobacter sp.]